jgi:hypothetical protein
MRRSTRLVLASTIAFGVLAALHCGPGRQRVTVRVPPRVDLASLEQIGVVEFRSSSEDELGRLATERFAESARRDQGLVRMVDLGTEDAVLRSLGKSDWDPETYKTLGSEREIRTILLGELTLARQRPSVRVAPDLGSGSLSMKVKATLVVRLVEAESGAAIWSRTASAARSVGHLDVLGGEDVRIAAGDPNAAYGELVDHLVEQVTNDFHVHYEVR